MRGVSLVDRKQGKRRERRFGRLEGFAGQRERERERASVFFVICNFRRSRKVSGEKSSVTGNLLFKLFSPPPLLRTVKIVDFEQRWRQRERERKCSIRRNAL